MYDNYSNSVPSIKACGADSAQFYKQGVSSLEFEELIPPFNEKIIDLLGKGFRPTGAFGSKVSVYRYSGDDNVVKDSFILVKRDGNWFPSLGQNEYINKILDLSEKFKFINLGLVGAMNIPSLLEDTERQQGKKFNSEKDNIYVGFEMPSGFNIQITRGIASPLEADSPD